MLVLFVHPALSSFVERDLRILREAHEVAPLHFRGVGDLPTLVTAVAWCDLTFCWFGSIHAFFAVALSKLLRKPSVVVAGGYDVARVPEIGYGLLADRRKAWCPRFVFRNADLTLAVSECSRGEAIANAGADPARVRLLYHGFEADHFRPLDGVAKDAAAVTVATVNAETVVKKGIGLFVASGRHLPAAQLVVVGPLQDDAARRLEQMAPPNVSFRGGRYGDDLVRAYSQSRVYVQPSVHESFGCSVAEAMLCECVPVVSRRAALPEVVGDAGVYIEALTPEAVADGIREAMASDLGPAARQRIIERFPFEARQRLLLEYVEEVGAAR